ncbi:FAD-dependent monooxygenase [Mycolicibacterium arseniciresistens]|uniref:FAD-dependent monooxygenase n=1 Tax=Mycolicibacterium arseniciresistens TaxID=3062257 RepID=A0ABT8U9P3_9MYCO|nr:FAD-dependent monooxygenase [Mycolicibacterium arseniciresistens]MDO3634506.1 FAD-dependent monooxygenase [Mycolicibacterium arseniciresistens]
MSPHAVISGAGIAGPALAHQLAARGWRTTVVERFPRRREEGQNVDIRGAAREVVARMGIDDDVRAAGTGEIGTRFVKADGSAAASFPVASPGGRDGPTAELEILRGELSRILIEHTEETTDYLFDTRIADVTDHGSHVTAMIDDGAAIDADLVVIAEGLHSRSRRFVSSVDVDELGMYFAYATIPRLESDDQWWNWQHATQHRGVHLRPDNLGTTRAILSFICDVRGFDDLDRDGQITILRSTFADVGGAAPRVIAALEDGAPMYFSAVGQVRSPSWSRGRIALLGDAAFCNATFGGAGTSLALIGAYVLAGELAGGDDVRRALTEYQRVMQPFVATAPTVRAGVLRLANPRTRNGIRVLHAGAGLAAGPIGRAVAAVSSRGLGNIGGDPLALPDYPNGHR